MSDEGLTRTTIETIWRIEAARLIGGLVRFAGDTVKNAVAQPQANPVAAAGAGAQQAAQVHAPGLLGSGSPGGASSGRWVRRGGKIIVMGV